MTAHAYALTLFDIVPLNTVHMALGPAVQQACTCVHNSATSAHTGSDAGTCTRSSRLLVAGDDEEDAAFRFFDERLRRNVRPNFVDIFIEDSYFVCT
jgi:hypothetical protein